jgi:hypothetical protein
MMFVGSLNNVKILEQGQILQFKEYSYYKRGSEWLELKENLAAMKKKFAEAAK